MFHVEQGRKQTTNHHNSPDKPCKAKKAYKSIAYNCYLKRKKKQQAALCGVFFQAKKKRFDIIKELLSSAF